MLLLRRLEEGKAQPISYELAVEDSEIVIKCKECKKQLNPNLTNKACLACVVQALSEEPDIERITLSHWLEREYFGTGIKLLKIIARLKNEILRFSVYHVEKNYKKCSKCRINPKTLFRALAERLVEDLELGWKLVSDKLKELKNFHPAFEPCTTCKQAQVTNLEHIIEKLSQLAKFVKIEGYKVILDKQNDDFKISRLKKGIERILARDQTFKPSFSSFWLMPAQSSCAELIKEYLVEPGCKVALYALPEETEDLYHVLPSEYRLPLDYIKLIDLAKAQLEVNFPSQREISESEEAKSYVAELGTKLIYELAEQHKIKLGNAESDRLEVAKFLAEILAKYSAGLGVLEIFLKDPRIQDIYIDAPASKNKIYLSMTNISPKLRTKLQTNICLTTNEAESLLSRFRYSAGRPFSEAFPVLECDLDKYGTRVTALGKPLSPDGLAFALRRHSSEPWTLLKLIHNKTISSLGAALLSFLLDSRSALLVTGSRGAGKTSLLSALMLEFPRAMRILTIEDTLELPCNRLQALGYKVQSLLTRSSVSTTSNELTPEKALHVALRLGDSALVIGEVRGSEAKTLYEAMRTGTAGSSVLGTIHGNSAKAVFERVVYDLGIPAQSFSATDIVVVMNLIRPHGSQRQVRKVIQIAELSKSSREGEFYDLMLYEPNEAQLKPTSYFQRSEKLKSIARAWGIGQEEIFQNIAARAEIRKAIVEHAESTKNYELLSPKWVLASNNAFWNLIEKKVSTGRINYSELVKEWKEWFFHSLEHV